MTKRLAPDGSPDFEALQRKLGGILMDFVCHNQKPFSKQLNSFIATGMHDVRAGLVVVDILKEVHQYLNGPTAVTRRRRSRHAPDCSLLIPADEGGCLCSCGRDKRNA